MGHAPVFITIINESKYFDEISGKKTKEFWGENEYIKA